jgi:TM2 domain-containing membrane protein YozV
MHIISGLNREGLNLDANDVENKTAQTNIKRKRPLLALFFSLVAPGTGQYYNDQWKKAVILLSVYFGIFIVTLYLMLQFIGYILLPIVFLIWLFGMYDAFTTARKINRSQPARDWFSKPERGGSS